MELETFSGFKIHQHFCIRSMMHPLKSTKINFYIFFYYFFLHTYSSQETSKTLLIFYIATSTDTHITQSVTEKNRS